MSSHTDVFRVEIFEATGRSGLVNAVYERPNVIWVDNFKMEVTEGEDVPCNCTAGPLTVKITKMFQEWDPAPQQMQWEVWAEQLDDGSYIYLRDIAELIVEMLVGK